MSDPKLLTVTPRIAKPASIDDLMREIQRRTNSGRVTVTLADADDMFHTHAYPGDVSAMDQAHRKRQDGLIDNVDYAELIAAEHIRNKPIAAGDGETVEAALQRLVARLRP